MAHDNPPSNRFEVKSKPSTLKKHNENISPQQKCLYSIPLPSVPLRNILPLEVGAVILNVCQGRQEKSLAFALRILTEQLLLH